MNYAIILAGGIGVRMGNTKIPKQFATLCERPIIVYALESANKNKNFDCICIVAALEWHDKIKEWILEFGITKKVVFAEAGKLRQQSVHSGLKAISAKKKDVVMIMTAVCPFVCQNTINNSFEMMETYDACITVVKATDAITFSNDGKVVNRTLQKSKMFVQQGPQTFRYGVLKQGHENYEADEGRGEVNEDSELVLDLGITVGMVLGDRFCMKVTYPEDLLIAEAIKPIFEEKESEEELA